VQQLKEEIVSVFADTADTSRLHIMVISFGFKFGIPLDADLVIDVRFLPNPHYEPDLRPLTGNDKEVRDFVFSSQVTTEFMDKYADLLEFLLPYYIKEGKTTLMVAIGCTGGKHRSVALANRLGDLLNEQELRVTVRHRDLKRS
jgi:UPF0042 nucleotide-binding protein